MLRVLLARPDWSYRPCGYERRYGADRSDWCGRYEWRYGADRAYRCDGCYRCSRSYWCGWYERRDGTDRADGR